MESLFCAGALDELIQISGLEPLVKRLGVGLDIIKDMALQQYSKCGRVARDLTEILQTGKVQDLNQYDEVIIWGYIAEFKEIFTRAGKKMAFIRFDTYEGRYDITVFDNVLSLVKLKQNVLTLMKVGYGKGIICRDLQYIEGVTE